MPPSIARARSTGPTRLATASSCARSTSWPLPVRRRCQSRGTRETETARVVRVGQPAPVARRERSREAAAALPEGDASATLDLEHLRAEVGENAGGERGRDLPREVEDADAVEGAHHTSPSG